MANQYVQDWATLIVGMEDSHTIHLYLPPAGSALSSPSTQKIPAQPAGSTVTNDGEGKEGNAFFGVFDGHGGSAVAKFAGTTVHSRLANNEAYREPVMVPTDNKVLEITRQHSNRPF
jgi:serine/threonine protein phosphatase PrpC